MQMRQNGRRPSKCRSCCYLSLLLCLVIYNVFQFLAATTIDLTINDDYLHYYELSTITCCWLSTVLIYFWETLFSVHVLIMMDIATHAYYVSTKLTYQSLRSMLLQLMYHCSITEIAVEHT